jgi:hypothetical protein
MCSVNYSADERNIISRKHIMSNIQQRVVPIKVIGHDIPVSLTADHFWMWEDMAARARDYVRTDPQKARTYMNDLAKDMQRVFEFAMKNRPQPGSQPEQPDQ